MKCIAHYPYQGKYTKLKSLSDVNQTKIKKSEKMWVVKIIIFFSVKPCLKFSMTIFMVFIVKHVTRSK